MDAKDNRGWTPLMCAASNGFVDTVKALLDAKASAAEVNKEGRNSLHIAGEKDRGFAARQGAERSDELRSRVHNVYNVL